MTGRPPVDIPLLDWRAATHWSTTPKPCPTEENAVADGVHHTRTRKDLNLNRKDLGLDHNEHNIEEIWTEILTPISGRDRSLLMCVARADDRECKAEASGVKSPYMVVRKQRGSDGALRYIAAHLPTPHNATPEESDKHKAMKSFIARICDNEGLKYGVEKATKSRSARPDITVKGDGGRNLGCEAQYYNAPADNVRRRSRYHAEAGLTANWITDNDTFDLIDRANYIVTPRYTWKQIDHAADISALGGARVLVEWRCTAAGSGGRPCPEGKITRGGIIGTSGCGKIHLHWETPRLADGSADDYGTTAAFTVGCIITGAATGDMDSLFIPERKDRRSGRYLWVPSADKKRWLEYCGGEELPEEDEDVLDDEVKFSGQEINETCRYGEEGFKPSAPRQRRAISSIGLTMTIDGPEDDEPDDKSPQTQEQIPGPEEDSQPPTRPRRTITICPPSLLDWSNRVHFSPDPAPCRICGKPAYLLDDDGRYAHKVCVEGEL